MRLPIRGGNWNNGAEAGLAALNLNERRSNANWNIGFRPALAPSCQKPVGHGRQDGASGKRRQAPSLQWENINSPARPVGEARWPRGLSLEPCVRTFNNLWDQIIDFENLHSAYLRARKGKRYRADSLAFGRELEENLITLQNELVWGMYRPGPHREFIISDPKPRTISAPPFRDRVVHHALVAIIEPCFERRFVAESFACREGKGPHRAVLRLQRHMRIATRNWGQPWALKADIAKYFPSIDHAVLRRIIRRTIADRRTLDLIDRIIGSRGPRGLPIGALTSQLFANVYLDQLDHFLKDRIGARHYVRYMDDFIVAGPTRAAVVALREDIRAYLGDTLALTLNAKTRELRVRDGIEFCGFRVRTTHITPRKASLRRSYRRLRKLSRDVSGPRTLATFKASLMSTLAHLSHSSARRSTSSMLHRITIPARRDT